MAAPAQIPNAQQQQGIPSPIIQKLPTHTPQISVAQPIAMQTPPEEMTVQKPQYIPNFMYCWSGTGFIIYESAENRVKAISKAAVNLNKTIKQEFGNIDVYPAISRFVDHLKSGQSFNICVSPNQNTNIVTYSHYLLHTIGLIITARNLYLIFQSEKVLPKEIITTIVQVIDRVRSAIVDAKNIAQKLQCVKPFWVEYIQLLFPFLSDRSIDVIGFFKNSAIPNPPAEQIQPVVQEASQTTNSNSLQSNSNGSGKVKITIDGDDDSNKSPNNKRKDGVEAEHPAAKRR